MTNLRQTPQTLILTISLAIFLTLTINAQTMPPTPSVSSECSSALFNLTDCLTYVEQGSNTTKPDKACCPELAGLIDSNPVCLCDLLGGAAESYGIYVDNKRALALPGICHVSTPPISTCAALGIPVDLGPSPAESPTESPTPSVSSQCTDALFNLTDCLTYVEQGSNATKPDKSCCPELAGLIDSNPVCLCELLAGAAESYGIYVDDKRALALPGICHVSTPPVSTCALLGIPVDLGPSPAESPMSGGPSPSSEPLLPGASTAAPPSKQSNRASRVFDSANLLLTIIFTVIAILEASRDLSS